MKYLLRYEMAPDADLERIGTLFPAHRESWSSFRKEGTLLAIGPLENIADGALAVFTTLDAAERFAAGDPFVTGGVVGRWQVSGWQEVLLGEPSGAIG